MDKCKNCDFTSPNRNSLRSHCRRHNHDYHRMMPYERRKTNQCRYCEFLTTSSLSLRLHMQRLHDPADLVILDFINLVIYLLRNIHLFSLNIVTSYDLPHDANVILHCRCSCDQLEGEHYEVLITDFDRRYPQQTTVSLDLFLVNCILTICVKNYLAMSRRQIKNIDISSSLNVMRIEIYRFISKEIAILEGLQEVNFVSSNDLLKNLYDMISFFSE